MDQSVRYQNHHINVTVEGTGEILIFLHGWPTNSRLWNAQMERLKSDYKVIALDWLGFGKSDKPVDHKYTFSNKKEILDTVIDDLVDEKEMVNIIAHDVGGPPAILWANEHQEKVKRLVLLNTILFPFSTLLDKMSHIFFNVPGLNTLLVSQFGLNNLMTTLSRSKDKGTKKRIDAILGWHKNWNSVIKLKAILEPLDEGRQKELLTLEEKLITLDTLKYLLIAKGDPLCYKHMKTFQEKHPDIPAYTIEKCGHFIAIDQPDKLNEILLKILR